MPISRQPFPCGPPVPPTSFRWFHVVLTTYGTWLPGDARGFRTRKHRRHVAGDYKSPPKEDYSRKLNYSLSVLKQPPVYVDESLQSVLGLAIVERLRQLGAFVLVAGVVETHVHLLVKMPDHLTREWIGLAKKHAWFEMREVGCETKLWAKRAKFTTVEDRRHLENGFRYIVSHEKEGGWVWIWEGLPDRVVEKVLNRKL